MTTTNHIVVEFKAASFTAAVETLCDLLNRRGNAEEHIEELRAICNDPAIFECEGTIARASPSLRLLAMIAKLEAEEASNVLA